MFSCKKYYDKFYLLKKKENYAKISLKKNRDNNSKLRLRIVYIILYILDILFERAKTCLSIFLIFCQSTNQSTQYFSYIRLTIV